VQRMKGAKVKAGVRALTLTAVPFGLAHVSGQGFLRELRATRATRSGVDCMIPPSDGVAEVRKQLPANFNHA
jgi:hypothetical protein